MRVKHITFYRNRKEMVEMVDEMSPKMSPQLMKTVTKPTMTFAQCLEQLLLGRKCRRLEWEDKGVYITIQNEILVLYRTDDKKLHPLKVSTGDIEGTDWVVVEKEENLS